ncbi:MAG: 3-hydroxyacyl-ACP dehydratase FabZ [Desulfobacterales bacterium]|nr:3-hydroxyacyl-ACP dehydratase FabZ [Desulfobacterales bacterium]
METLYDIQKIMELLYHRYPFILVDRIMEIAPNERIVGLKNVTINEPFFQGHFPGMPVMPGVLIIEAIAQVGAVLAYASRAPDEREVLFYFAGIDKARFRKPVFPGDQLILEIVSLKTRTDIFKFSGKATVDGTLVAETEITAVTGEKL